MPVHSLLCYGAASNNLAFHFFSNWEGHVIVVFSKYLQLRRASRASAARSGSKGTL